MSGSKDLFARFPRSMWCLDCQLCQCFSCFILVKLFEGFKFLRIQIGGPLNTFEISKHITGCKIVLHSELNFAYTHYIQCPYYFPSIHCFSSSCCENLLMWRKKTRMKTIENSPLALIQYWECATLTAKEKRVSLNRPRSWHFQNTYTIW